MKVIFLDIDGVLATPASYGEPSYFFADGVYHGDKWARLGFHGLAKDCCKMLQELAEEADAKIVISSTWRHGEPEDFMDLCRYLKKCGVTAPIIGRTGSHRKRFSDYRYSTYERGDEIKEFVDTYPKEPITHFVVFDDDSDMKAVWDNFVHIPEGWHTFEPREDTQNCCGKGLQPEHIEKAKEILECC